MENILAQLIWLVKYFWPKEKEGKDSDPAQTSSGNGSKIKFGNIKGKNITIIQIQQMDHDQLKNSNSV